MNRVHTYLGALLILGSLFSCRSSKEIVEEKLPRVKDSDLVTALDSMFRQQVEFFYAKIATDYKDSSEKHSFKTSVRLKSDSIFHAVLSFANIPMVNAQMTNDSVYMTNRRDKCYREQSLDYLRKQFGVSFSSKNVEQLLLGTPIAFDPEQKYHQIDDDGMYLICSHKKREIKRNEKKGDREIITYYGLSRDLHTLDRVIIESPEDTATIQIDYLERELEQGLLVPKRVITVVTTARNVVEVELNYKKVRINERETIHFVIPEDYELCE